ncbi:hypothetical protein BDN72DRAFT_295936 [Pluteus cervinus]|uniref:Uncharacterized protein n=1 Tax=Pluteus cervinus TaxID=181527 RepID=A0ACD3B3R0_9AGAR|nr:hypothetical protein BDN72DRAFT_295936 [Pluteus cervinus]
MGKLLIVEALCRRVDAIPAQRHCQRLQRQLGAQIDRYRRQRNAQDSGSNPDKISKYRSSRPFCYSSNKPSPPASPDTPPNGTPPGLPARSYHTTAWTLTTTMQCPQRP